MSLSDRLKIRNLFAYSWSKIQMNQGYDLDGSILPGDLHQTGYVPGSKDATQLSEELQVQGSVPGLLDYTLGGFLQRNKSPTGSLIILAIPITTPAIPATQIVAGPGPKGHSNQDAIYGQITLRGEAVGLDRLSLTLGGRQTWTDDADGMLTHKDSGFSYSISADYKPTADTLIYIAHRKGFKPGGVNSTVLLPPNADPVQFGSYEEEVVKDLEIGGKASFVVGGVRGNAGVALFQQWYTGAQVNNPINILNTFVDNAEKAKVKGLEFDLSLALTDRLRLSGWYSYIDAEYSEFNRAFFGNLDPNTPVTYIDERRRFCFDTEEQLLTDWRL